MYYRVEGVTTGDKYIYDTRVISSIKLINLTKTYTQSMARFAASPPQCFAAHVYCTPGACRCNECNNLSAFEATRVGAIESALARNLNAFTNKVTKAEKRASMTTSTGCNCRKSLCLKKYCECFFTGMLCTSECKCVNCENYSGSVALMNKREQMQKDKEVADLVKEVGAAGKGGREGEREGGREGAARVRGGGWLRALGQDAEAGARDSTPPCPLPTCRTPHDA
jgi:hypothetical protein